MNLICVGFSHSNKGLCNKIVSKLSEIVKKKSGIGRKELRNKCYIRDAFYFAVDHIPS